MLKTYILPKTPRELRSNFQIMRSVLKLVYIDNYKKTFWPKLMQLKRRKQIYLPLTSSSALSKHAHFQIIYNVKSIAFFKHTSIGLSTT